MAPWQARVIPIASCEFVCAYMDMRRSVCWPADWSRCKIALSSLGKLL